MRNYSDVAKAMLLTIGFFGFILFLFGGLVALFSNDEVVVNKYQEYGSLFCQSTSSGKLKTYRITHHNKFDKYIEVEYTCENGRIVTITHDK